MRKKLFFRAFAALSALMTCLACRVTLEPDLQREMNYTSRRSVVQTMVLTASLELPADETKTALDGSHVVWKAGDQIKVFNATNPTGVVFTLDPACDGQTLGTFTGGAVSGTGPFYAVYPASVATELSGSAVSVNVPQVQTLTAGCFGPGANISLAKVDELSEKLAFKNVLGALKISLNSSISATRVRIQTKAAEPLWGSGTLTTDGSIPTLALAPGTADNQIIEASGAASGTDFYVMVPAGTLASGFVAQVAANDGYGMIKQTTANNSVPRSGVRAMLAFDYVAQFQASFLNISALPFGYSSGIQSGGTPMQLFTFATATSQYASKVVVDADRTFRMQDFSTGKYYSFVLPYALVLGGSYDATVESVVGSTYTAPADAGSFMLVQRTSNAGWFVKSDNTCGFIFLLED